MLWKDHSWPYLWVRCRFLSSLLSFLPCFTSKHIYSLSCLKPLLSTFSLSAESAVEPGVGSCIRVEKWWDQYHFSISLLLLCTCDEALGNLINLLGFDVSRDQQEAGHCRLQWLWWIGPLQHLILVDSRGQINWWHGYGMDMALIWQCLSVAAQWMRLDTRCLRSLARELHR